MKSASLTAALSWCSASQCVGTPRSSSFFFSGLSGSVPSIPTIIIIIIIIIITIIIISIPIADRKVDVWGANLPPKMDLSWLYCSFMLGLQPEEVFSLVNEDVKMLKHLLSSYLAALMEAPGAALPLVNISLGPRLPRALPSLEERSPMGGTYGFSGPSIFCFFMFGSPMSSRKALYSSSSSSPPAD